MVDARRYDAIGRNLAQGKGFRLVDGGAPADNPAIAVVGPEYPYVLAGIYGLLGLHIEPVWILQTLLHALNALLIYFIAGRVLGESRDREGLAV